GSALSWTLNGVTVTASQSSPRCDGSNAGLTGGTPLAGSGRLMVGPDVLALPPIPETTFPGPGDTGNGDEDDDGPPPPPPTGGPALPSGEDDPGLPQPPAPSVSTEATGNLSDFSGFPSDTNLAVSHTHVVVTARAAVGVYKRVNPGPSEGPP